MVEKGAVGPRFPGGLYDDKLYSGDGYGRGIHYYVRYSEEKGEGGRRKKPGPVIQCQKTLDWMKVILISVGSGCGLFAIGFIAYRLARESGIQGPLWSPV